MSETIPRGMDVITTAMPWAAISSPACSAVNPTVTIQAPRTIWRKPSPRKIGTNDRMSIVAVGGTGLASWLAKRSSRLGFLSPPDKPMGSRESGDQRAMGWPCAVVQSILVPVRVDDVWSCLSRFFFCFQGQFLFVFDLFLFYLLVEVAPVAARNDELVDLELRMKALCPVKQISVERILCGKPDAG